MKRALFAIIVLLAIHAQAQNGTVISGPAVLQGGPIANGCPLTGCTFTGTVNAPLFIGPITGIATHAVDLTGTVIDSVPYMSAAGVTSYLSPNTTATPKAITMTGNGTIGNIPVWNPYLDPSLTTLQTMAGPLEATGTDAIPAITGANVNGIGTKGYSVNGVGAAGYSESGSGVSGYATDGTGAYASSINGHGGYFFQGGALTANTTAPTLSVSRGNVLGSYTSTGPIIQANDTSGSGADLLDLQVDGVDKFLVNSNGDLNVTGSVTAATVKASNLYIINVIMTGVVPGTLTSGTDNSSVLTALFNSGGTIGNTCLYFPAGFYHFTSTIVSTQNPCIVATPEAVLIFDGTGTAISISRWSKQWSGGLTLRSSQGPSVATTGIAVQFSTELQVEKLYIGGSPASSFGVGIHCSGCSGTVFRDFTSSWNPVGMLFGSYNGTNASGVLIEDGNFWQAPTAGIQLEQVNSIEIRNSWFEANQNSVLLDNTSENVLVQNVNLHDNNASLQDVTSGVTFTNPQFINFHTGNSANAFTASNIQVRNNRVIVQSTNCNSFTRSGGTTSTAPWEMVFSNNRWGECTVASIYGDTANVAVQTKDERYTSTSLLGGALTGFVSNTDASGTQTISGVNGGGNVVEGNLRVTNITYGISSSVDGQSGYGNVQNILLQSNSFSTSPWLHANLTLAGTNPSTLTESSDSVPTYHFIHQYVTISEAGTYTFAFKVKTNGDGVFVTDSLSGGNVSFDLTNGTVYSSNGSTPSIVALNDGSGLYRITYTVTFGSAGVDDFYIYTTNSSFLDNYVGNGTNGIYLQQTQMNAGSSASVYAGTTTTAFGPVFGESSPALIVNSGSPLTSQSSANSQIVTCPTGGTGTQYCDAAGEWVTPGASGLGANTFTGAQTAPGFFLQSGAAGPYAQYWEEFWAVAQNVNIATGAIGSATGDSCLGAATYQDTNHPGNMVATSGTGGTGTGVVCYSPAHLGILNTSASWTYETVVYPSVLPGSTVASFQAGVVYNAGADPWATGIGFQLSSANGVANDWYCGYTTTFTDSSTLATVAWTRLTLTNDGTKIHWYINGAEVCGTGVAITSLPSVILIPAWTSTAKSGTSVSLGVDYGLWNKNVSR